MDNEVVELARVLHGEAITCYNLSIVFLAIAHIYKTKNDNFYGHYSGDDISPTALWIAENWQTLPDPTGGAEYMFSSIDIQKEEVQDIIRGRGPPVLVVECNPYAGAEQLLFYR